MIIRSFSPLFFLFILALLPFYVFTLEQNPWFPIDKGVGVSSNPSPGDHIGTGYMADEIYKAITGSKNNTGFTLEGLWILDGNQLFIGGQPNTHKDSLADLFQLELLFDTGKVSSWKKGLFAIEFLQLNGMSTNSDAGLVQGFEGLIQGPPLNRSCFMSWWYRQEFFNGKIITRIGKSTPNCDFNSVTLLYPINDDRESPVASGVIYGTIFNQGSLTYFLPSYYNSALGASIFYFPIKDFYISLGGYDGNKARGEQTGMQTPKFNGYYFFISESGYSWSDAKLPGRIAVGAWKQTGKLYLETTNKTITQNGVYGIYLYGSQRLWWKDRKNANSGIVTYLQLGYNNTKTLPINKFLSFGITTYGLIPCRLQDSFGVGSSIAGLNKTSEPNAYECMYQAYYQYFLFDSIYLEPVISYIPKPGAVANLPPTWAGTIRILTHF